METMGELLDQVMAGGPELLPLTHAQQELADALASEPARWAFELSRPGLLSALRAALATCVPGTGRPPHTLDCAYVDYDMLVASCATKRADDVWARKLLAWCGHGPSMLLGAPEFYAAFRRAVLERARFDAANRALQESVLAHDVRWDNNPYQILALAIREQ